MPHEAATQTVKLHLHHRPNTTTLTDVTSTRTVRPAAEQAVVLEDVGDDAQAVGLLAGHHVAGVEQGGDAQLCFCHLEGLQNRNRSQESKRV